MMHVVVTGASGFVARTLIPALAQAQCTGIAVARRSVEQLPSGWHFRAREEVLTGASEARVDALIHLEARHHQYVVGEASASEVAAFTDVNVGNTARWLDWARRARVPRFVYYSSIKAIDTGRAGTCGSLDETAPGPGNTLYGRCKWQAEQEVAAWAVKDAQRCALILRPAVIYGPENRANIYSMVSAIAQRRFIYVGANDNIKSLVSVRNASAATVHLLSNMRPGSHIYNLVDARRYSVRELAELIARELSVPPPSTSLPENVIRPLARVADRLSRLFRLSLPISSARVEALCEHADFSPAKLQSTGFVHAETTEAGLANVIHWYQGQGRSARLAKG